MTTVMTYTKVRIPPNYSSNVPQTTRPNSKQVDTQLEPSPSRDESPVPQKLLRWILSCQEPQWFAIFAHDRQGTQAVRSPVEQET